MKHWIRSSPLYLSNICKNCDPCSIGNGFSDCLTWSSCTMKLTPAQKFLALFLAVSISLILILLWSVYRFLKRQRKLKGMVRGVSYESHTLNTYVSYEELPWYW